MQEDKFHVLFEGWSSLWLKSDIENGGTEIPISSLCSLKPDSWKIVYHYYNIIKSVMKDTYFKSSMQSVPTLNRYKRAAVIAYAILKSDPLTLSDNCIEDRYFLKQRLAFFIAVGSILQDFDKEEVAAQRIFRVFNRLGERDYKEGNDTFLMSIYKDMFFSELYMNYNILTMANVFGLLFESAAGFDQLNTLDAKG